MLKFTHGVGAPALFLCLLLPTFANAQTRVYVTGEFFAKAMQLSRTRVSPELADGASDLLNPDNGVTVGGGGRIGAFFTPVWSLEFGIDAGKALSDERTRSLRNSTGLPLPFPSFEYVARTSQQFTTASVLVGYHPVVRGRIQPGFRGGVSFVRAERQFTVASISTITVTPIRPGGGQRHRPDYPHDLARNQPVQRGQQRADGDARCRGGDRFHGPFRRRAGNPGARGRHRRNPAASGRGRSLALVARG